jgi:hypothetical protein
MYDTEMKVPVQLNIKYYIIGYKSSKRRIGHFDSDRLLLNLLLRICLDIPGWFNKK